MAAASMVCIWPTLNPDPDCTRCRRSVFRQHLRLSSQATCGGKLRYAQLPLFVNRVVHVWRQRARPDRAIA
jgi:hypothetical protein